MLFVLVGMIASGKSTYCRQKVEDEGAIIVNDDAVCHAIHGKHFYDPTLRGLYKTVENTIARSGLAQGRDVLIDRPNLCVRTRSKYIELAREFGQKCGAVVFPFASCEVHAQRRFDHDNRGYSFTDWLRKVQENLEEYEPVTMSEGFDWIVKK